MAATLGRAALVLPQIVDAVECIGHGVFELVPCFLPHGTQSVTADHEPQAKRK